MNASTLTLLLFLASAFTFITGIRAWCTSDIAYNLAALPFIFGGALSALIFGLVLFSGGDGQKVDAIMAFLPSEEAVAGNGDTLFVAAFVATFLVAGIMRAVFQNHRR